MYIRMTWQIPSSICPVSSSLPLGAQTKSKTNFACHCGGKRHRKSSHSIPCHAILSPKGPTRYLIKYFPWLLVMQEEEDGGGGEKRSAAPTKNLIKIVGCQRTRSQTNYNRCRFRPTQMISASSGAGKRGQAPQCGVSQPHQPVSPPVSQVWNS